jgi:phosphoribosylformylglycinamidine synthase
VTAVHDVADGGLAAAVAEMALAGRIGAEFDEVFGAGLAARWFGEDQGRYVVTTPDFSRIRAAVGDAVPCEEIGTTGCLNRLTGGKRSCGG